MERRSVKGRRRQCASIDSVDQRKISFRYSQESFGGPMRRGNISGRGYAPYNNRGRGGGSGGGGGGMGQGPSWTSWN
jgi:hypothetical protein